MAAPSVRVPVKLVLIGDSGVGKTSLVTRWITGLGTFDFGSTIGANHQRRLLTIGGNEVDLQIWDTAGQEQFHALTPLYARSSAVAILVTSIADPATFESIDDWLDILYSAAPEGPPIILAVNKIDLEGESTSPRDEIFGLCSSRAKALFFVSALTDEGVDDLFMCAAESGLRFCLGQQTREAPVPLLEPASASCC
jgi:small GTP-binding protein